MENIEPDTARPPSSSAGTIVSSPLLALMLAASLSPADPALPITNVSNTLNLSLVCRIQDWVPPPFVSSIDAARATLDDDGRQWLQQFEKSLRNKSLERERGDVSVIEFDRFVERTHNEASRAKPELKPILETITARYSRTIGVDRVLSVNNERLLAEHEASKAAKPLLGKYVQLRYINGLTTWQESMQKIIDKLPLEVVEPQSSLKPSLSISDSTVRFTLSPAPSNPVLQTTAEIDRYTGEMLLEKSTASGRLLYSFTGQCDTQAAPRF